MEKTQINQEMTLACPDGFRVMEKEELSQYSFIGEEPGICFNDPERRIVLSIGWRRVNGLVAMLAGTKDTARAVAVNIQKPMSQYGFRNEGFLSRKIGAKPADGFRYRYEVQDIGMTGESWVVKNGKTFYYFNLYYRTEMQEESVKVIEEIFDSVAWES